MVPSARRFLDNFHSMPALEPVAECERQGGGAPPSGPLAIQQSCGFAGDRGVKTGSSKAMQAYGFLPRSQIFKLRVEPEQFT